MDTAYLDSLTPSQVRADGSLTEAQMSYLSSLDGIPMQEAVSEHPSTGTAALEYLVRFSHSPKVVRTALDRPNMPRSAYLAAYGRAKMREILAELDSTPTDLVSLMCSDSSPAVRRAATRAASRRGVPAGS